MPRTGVLDARQIRAARALMDWSQEDLATASTLSVATIRKIESGHISPRGRTTELIRRALEDAGLEFLEPDGVRHRPEDISVYLGNEGFRDFFDDIYQTARKKGGEIVVVCTSEVFFNAALGDEFRFAHYQRMSALKDRVSVKCILTENGDVLPATAYCEYRWISKHYVDSVPFYVYDDKYAIITLESDSPKIIVIQSRSTAEAFRHQFYSMWEKATPIGGSSNVEQMPRKVAGG
jgi:transcriptional regulator with XRE-family HTH domain